MPAPTNTSFATATELGELSTTDLVTTQQVDDAGTTYTVYFTGTVPAEARVVSAYAFGDLTVYKPTIEPYEGALPTPTAVLGGITAQNKPVQFPVTGGAQYWFKVTTNAGNPSPANLTLKLQVAETRSSAIGAIAINDDTSGFPLAILSGTADYTVLRFQNEFPAGEGGDTLSNGRILVENIATDTVDLYKPGADYALVTQIPAVVGAQRWVRTCLAGQVFYVGEDANPASFFSVTSAGVASTRHTLTGITSLGALAANNAQTLVYFAEGPNGSAIKTWAIGGAAGPDFAVGIANNSVSDILVLSDDTLIVGYANGGTSTYQVKHYDTDGSTLRTYPLGTFRAIVPRLASAIDDPASFWVLFEPSGADSGKCVFYNIQVSDGTILTTRTSAGYEQGAYQAAASATPLARFGNSLSCPFWIVRAITATRTRTIRRLRQFQLPSDPDNRMMFCSRLELLLKAGIGLLPDGSGTPVAGEVPRVMMRISRDGGQTWGPERWVSAGERGKWMTRVRWLRNGRYRNAVVQLVVDAPVDWQLLSMSGDFTVGSS